MRLISREEYLELAVNDYVDNHDNIVLSPVRNTECNVVLEVDDDIACDIDEYYQWLAVNGDKTDGFLWCDELHSYYGFTNEAAATEYILRWL